MQIHLQDSILYISPNECKLAGAYQTGRLQNRQKFLKMLVFKIYKPPHKKTPFFRRSILCDDDLGGKPSFNILFLRTHVFANLAKAQFWKIYQWKRANFESLTQPASSLQTFSISSRREDTKKTFRSVFFYYWCQSNENVSLRENMRVLLFF